MPRLLGKRPAIAKPAGKSRRGPSDKESAKADESKKKKKPRTLRSEGRESMEAMVVAFILAFLFRTFEAEAFVIPTGSMAPTLLGRNKEAECPQCGQHIVVGASEEIDQESGLLKSERVETAFCPNCRYEVLMREQPVFTGDRILVTKFSYEMEEPRRFDVIVFKYPQEPQTNYIKRLVGLPGEEIQNPPRRFVRDRDGRRAFENPGKRRSQQAAGAAAFGLRQRPPRTRPARNRLAGTLGRGPANRHRKNPARRRRRGLGRRSPAAGCSMRRPVRSCLTREVRQRTQMDQVSKHRPQFR